MYKIPVQLVKISNILNCYFYSLRKKNIKKVKTKFNFVVMIKCNDNFIADFYLFFSNFSYFFFFTVYEKSTGKI